MNYFFVFLAIVFIIYILNSIKKGEFSIDESIFWFVGSIGVLILSIVPNIIIYLAEKLHVEYAPSLLFLLAIMFLLYLVFRNTKKISKQNDKIIELAQRCSILEFELKEKKE